MQGMQFELTLGWRTMEFSRHTTAFSEASATLGALRFPGSQGIASCQLSWHSDHVFVNVTGTMSNVTHYFESEYISSADQGY